MDVGQTDQDQCYRCFKGVHEYYAVNVRILLMLRSVFLQVSILYRACLLICMHDRFDQDYSYELPWWSNAYSFIVQNSLQDFWSGVWSTMPVVVWQGRWDNYPRTVFLDFSSSIDQGVICWQWRPIIALMDDRIWVGIE